jgi:hypothetical protein
MEGRFGRSVCGKGKDKQQEAGEIDSIFQHAAPVREFPSFWHRCEAKGKMFIPKKIPT